MSLLHGALSEAGYMGATGARRADGERRRTHGIASRIEAAFEEERGRWFLWLPVFYGAGIGFYLTLPVEPPLLLVVAGVLIASAIRILIGRTPLLLVISAALLMTALGMATAKLHALYTDAPVLQRTLTYTTIEGWVEGIERQEKRTRMTLRVIRAGDLLPADTPFRARVSISGKHEPPPFGSAISLRVTLMPPPEPALPGGFDFARFFWFQGIGASGYAMGKVEPLAGSPEAPLDVRLRAAIGSVRQAMSARISAALEGDRAAIAKALAIGERAGISDEANEALRDSGLAHVISISGFHMALMAGSLFWLIRALLALVPWIALRYPIKIWAAVGALAIAGLYLVLSGAPVTAVRSFIMVTIGFIAIMLSRPAISLRNLAISALLILAVMPQSILDAGFQMSFAATAALIAFYERRTPKKRFEGWPPLIAVSLIFLIEICLTSFFAGLAVDPLSAYHFHRVSLYSVIGNLLGLPVVTFVVMPLVLVTLIAMPFGLEALPLLVMDYGLEAMLQVARFTAGLPGAVLPVPSFAPGAITLIAAGGLWLIIWKGRWRWFGIVSIGVGLALAPLGERPDLWVDRDGKLVAIRGVDGSIETGNTRRASFSLERWMEADGDERPLEEVRGSRAFQCDEASCVAMVKGKLMSFVQHPEALGEDCRRADILIAAIPVTQPCPKPEIVIDASSLRQFGAQTVKITENGLIRRTVREKRGDRPWVTGFNPRENVPEIGGE